MRGHGALMWMCGALVVVALVVALATGSAVPFLPVIGCVLMMGAMMFMMGGTAPWAARAAPRRPAASAGPDRQRRGSPTPSAPAGVSASEHDAHHR
jgi:hypothetical protein